MPGIAESEPASPDPAGRPPASPDSAGRRFSARWWVRSADVTRAGLLRFDALARYLQDVAAADVADAGLAPDVAWALRRTTIEVLEPPRLAEPLRLTTRCSGLGERWAERHTVVEGAGGGHVEATALWVPLDPRSGRPVPLGEAFLGVYATAAGGRRVRARLVSPPSPDPGRRRPWQLRETDFDVLGHVNNSVHLAAAEDELHRLGLEGRPGFVEVEYRSPILGLEPVWVVTSPDSPAGGEETRLWLSEGTRTAAAIRMARFRP